MFVQRSTIECLWMDIAQALDSRQAMQVLLEASPMKLMISSSRLYALMSPAAGPFDKSALCEAFSCQRILASFSFDSMTKTLYRYCGIKVRK